MEPIIILAVVLFGIIGGLLVEVQKLKDELAFMKQCQKYLELENDRLIRNDFGRVTKHFKEQNL